MALGVTSKCWKSVGNLGATVGEVNTEKASPLNIKGQEELDKVKKEKFRLKEKETEFLHLQQVDIACMGETKCSSPVHPGTQPSTLSSAALSTACELLA